ncbi:MAG: hypothetical protein AAGF75_00810 [Cyanobacteria bacterium P01_H01_bin.130]
MTQYRDQQQSDLNNFGQFHQGGGDRADDPVPFERFELVSAYLDDEVTDGERQTVEKWLAEDPKVHALYVELGGLSQSLTDAPVPLSSSPEEIFAGVMAEVKQQQTKRRWVFGGAAMAAGIAAIVGSVAMGVRSPSFQLAQHGPSPLETEVQGTLAQSPSPAASAVEDEPILERALILE